MSKEEFWDKENIYDEQIAPLMSQIIDICRKNNLPIVATFQYCNKKENGAAYCSTALLSGNEDQHMRNVHKAVKASRPVAFAETHVTNPDGSKVISIKRV